MTAPRHAAPSLDVRLLRSPRYWVFVATLALVLLAAGVAALVLVTALDDVPTALRAALLAAGAWGVLVGLHGGRLAVRHRAGEPPTL